MAKPSYLQPQLIADFDGRYVWPDNVLDMKRLTVAGDAFSAAVQGRYDSNGVDMQCAWRGKLERLQSSVRPAALAAAGFAETAPALTATPANFKTPAAAPETSYLYFGDCEGRFTLTMPGDLAALNLAGQTTANNLKFVKQPATAHNRSHTRTIVGRTTGQSRSYGQLRSNHRCDRCFQIADCLRLVRDIAGSQSAVERSDR